MSPITKVMMEQLLMDYVAYGNAYIDSNGARIDPASVFGASPIQMARSVFDWVEVEAVEERTYLYDYSTFAELQDDVWPLLCMSGSQEDHADAQVWFRDVEEDYLEARWRGRS